MSVREFFGHILHSKNYQAATLKRNIQKGGGQVGNVYVGPSPETVTSLLNKHEIPALLNRDEIPAYTIKTSNCTFDRNRPSFDRSI